MLSEKTVRSILADRRKYLDAYVSTHFYDQAHNEQVIIHTLKVILEDVDEFGDVVEE